MRYTMPRCDLLSILSIFDTANNLTVEDPKEFTL